MFCTKCGRSILDNTKFCTGCGAPVEEAPMIMRPMEGPVVTEQKEGFSPDRPYIQQMPKQHLGQDNNNVQMSETVIPENPVISSETVMPMSPVAPTPVAPVAPTPVAPVAPTPVAPATPGFVPPVTPANNTQSYSPVDNNVEQPKQKSNVPLIVAISVLSLAFLGIVGTIVYLLLF